LPSLDTKAALRMGAAFLFSASLVLAAPDDRVALVISRDAFTPESLQARRGEVLKLRVSSADEEHCFALDEFRIEKRVRPGRPVTVDIMPDHTGTFAFHCCLEAAADAPRGRLIVSD
jgi:heme/copper-type cytochrome/quinol oxidase subunit 2